MKMKAQVQLLLPFMPYIALIAIAAIGFLFLIGYLQASGILPAAGEAATAWAQSTGIAAQKDYKIEIFKTDRSGADISDIPTSAMEGNKITFRAVYANDFTEDLTIYARAVIVPEERFAPTAAVFPSGMGLTSVGQSACCPGRESEAMDKITLKPNEYRIVEFTITVPTSASSYTCQGRTYSDYSPSKMYRIYIEAYKDCYTPPVETLSPVAFTAIANPTPPAPVVYQPIDSSTGLNIAHYIQSVKVEGPGGSWSCTKTSASPQVKWSCPHYGESQYVVVITTIRNGNSLNVEFLTEGILHPAENYDPFRVLGALVLQTRSCCGDSFSHGWWIKATPGATKEVRYALEIPKANPTLGKCSGRNYHSPSKKYYIKISDYVGCGGAQVQDLAPMLVEFT